MRRGSIRLGIAIALMATVCAGAAALSHAQTIYVEVGAVKTTFSASVKPKALPAAATKPSSARTDQAKIDAWYHHWILEGFTALETMVVAATPYAAGADVTLADICVVPQVANARRLKVPLDRFPKIVAIDAACGKLDAFIKARPDQQPDAE